MKFYHGSEEELAPGTTLVPGRVGGYVASVDPDLERLFEERRPDGMIPRHEAVFLVADPDEIDAAGGCTDHVMAVALPEGAVAERHDLSWYSEAQGCLSDGDADAARECADAYWAGTPFRDPHSSLFEYLVKEAVVVPGRGTAHRR